MSENTATGSGSISSAAFAAVSANEVSGNAKLADAVIKPNPNAGQNGNGGWTIGFNQMDFNTNATQAQAALMNALTASGQFTQAKARWGGTPVPI